MLKASGVNSGSASILTTLAGLSLFPRILNANLGLKTPPAACTFPPQTELTNLKGINDFTINGTKKWDDFRYSVSGVGDINHDGIADQLYAGQSYVVFGYNTSIPVASSGLHQFGLGNAASQKEHSLQTIVMSVEQNENYYENVMPNQGGNIFSYLL